MRVSDGSSPERLPFNSPMEHSITISYFLLFFLFLSQQTTSISFNTKALHNKRNQNGNENEDEDDDEDDLLIRHGFRHFDCHLERRNEGCRINRSTSDCYDVNSVEGIIM